MPYVIPLLTTREPDMDSASSEAGFIIIQTQNTNTSGAGVRMLAD